MALTQQASLLTEGTAAVVAGMPVPTVLVIKVNQLGQYGADDFSSHGFINSIVFADSRRLNGKANAFRRGLTGAFISNCLYLYAIARNLGLKGTNCHC